MKPSHPAGEHGTPGLGEMAPWVTLSLRWVMVQDKAVGVAGKAYNTEDTGSWL